MGLDVLSVRILLKPSPILEAKFGYGFSQRPIFDGHIPLFPIIEKFILRYFAFLTELITMIASSDAPILACSNDGHLPFAQGQRSNNADVSILCVVCTNSDWD